MVGRRMLCWTALSIGLLVARTAAADPITSTGITFTGNVPADFGYSNPTITSSSGEYVQVNSTTPYTSVVQLSEDLNSTHIAQPTWMTDNGLVSGWNFHNIAVSYNAQNDTLYVGINTWGIAGNVDGNGTPGTPNPQLTAAGGTDPAKFGGDKSMAIGITPLNGTQPTIVAGIPGNKAQAGTGLDGFTVATRLASSTSPGSTNYDLVNSFGQAIAAAAGSNLAFDPSAQHPGFEFTITNFSKILGYNPLLGFSLSAQDGSVNSVVTGKDYVPPTMVKLLGEQGISAPEPTTWLAWLILASGAGWKYRRSLAARP
jgi:hypothetical protein